MKSSSFISAIFAMVGSICFCLAYIIGRKVLNLLLSIVCLFIGIIYLIFYYKDIKK